MGAALRGLADALYRQEHRVHEGQKDIFHIEAFVAKFMSLYKKFLISLGS